MCFSHLRILAVLRWAKAALRSPTPIKPMNSSSHSHHDERHMAQGNVCTHNDDVTQHGAHASQPKHAAYTCNLIFDPFHGQLTAVKTMYPLTSITWPFCRLKCRSHPGCTFLKLTADQVMDLHIIPGSGIFCKFLVASQKFRALLLGLAKSLYYCGRYIIQTFKPPIACKSGSFEKAQKNLKIGTSNREIISKYVSNENNDDRLFVSEYSLPYYYSYSFAGFFFLVYNLTGWRVSREKPLFF